MIVKKSKCQIHFNSHNIFSNIKFHFSSLWKSYRWLLQKCLLNKNSPVFVLVLSRYWCQTFSNLCMSFMAAGWERVSKCAKMRYTMALHWAETSSMCRPMSACKVRQLIKISYISEQISYTCRPIYNLGRYLGRYAYAINSKKTIYRCYQENLNSGEICRTHE